jgi:hypothetical protein
MLGQREKLKSVPPVKYINERSRGQNLRSTLGQVQACCAALSKNPLSAFYGLYKYKKTPVILLEKIYK